MSQPRVSVLIELADKISAPMKKVEGAISRAVSRINVKFAAAGGERIAAGYGKVSAGLGDIATKSRGAALALSAVTGAIAGAAVSFIGPAAEMERFKVQLTSLEGSSAGAEKAMRWISNFAATTPLELNDTVAAYARLKAFGVDPTNGSLQALVDTMAATGGGAEQLDGLVMALGQSWTKGKLQSEEALQMLERGVPVWDLLADKLGKTSAEVQEMATKGALGRKEIGLLVEALGDRNKGASEGMAKTWGGIISNIKDQWSRFQIMVMDSGVFDYLKSRLQLFLDLLNQMAADGRLQAWADRVGSLMLAVLQGLWDFGEAVVGAWQAVAPAVEAAVELMGGWSNAIKIVLGLAFAAKLLGMARALITVAAGVAQVVTGIARLGYVLMANPIGIAVAAIAAGVYLIYRNWDAVTAWFTRLWNSVRTVFSGFAEFLAGIFTGDLGRAVDGLKAMWSGYKEYWRTLWDGVAGTLQSVWTQLIKPVLDAFGATDVVVTAWNGMRDGLSLAINAIGDAISAVWQGAIQPAIDALKGVGGIAGAWEAMRDALGAVLDWLAEKFSAVWAKISPVIDGLKWVKDKGANALAAVGIGDGSGPDMEAAARASADNPGTSGLAADRQAEVLSRQDAFRQQFHGADTPGLAQGGSFGPGPLIVGERGPELRFESRAGFIANHNALRGMEAMAQRVRAAASGALRPAAAGLSAFLPEARDLALSAVPCSAKSVSYSPSYSISLSGGGDPEAMRRLIVNELAAHERRVQVELRRLMHD